MKRPNDQQLVEPNKRQHTEKSFVQPMGLSIEPWAMIAEQMTDQSFGRILQTSSFFPPLLSYPKIIQTRYFDFNSQDELRKKLDDIQENNSENLTVNIKYQILVQQLSTQAYEVEKLVPGNSDNSLLKKFVFFIKEGNIVGLKSNPFFSDKAINLCSDNGMNLLGYAAVYKRKAIFNLLLKLGANILFEPLDQDPYANTHLITCNLGSSINANLTPIHVIAVLHADELWLQELFETFNDLPRVLFSPSYYEALNAIFMNDSKKLDLLLKDDPYLVEEFDPAGWKLFHWACCFKGKTACMDILIEKNTNLEDDELAPVFLAVASGNQTALEKLHEYKADFALDVFENTPLHLAAHNGEVEITKLLIDWGHDTDRTNSFGDTPLALLQNVEHPGLSLSQKLEESQCMKFSEESWEKRQCCEVLLLEVLNAGPTTNK